MERRGPMGLPGGIWALGFVSMFMDISSEMIHSLLPVFLLTTLGASAAMVGVIEGIGEATASFAKLFSGWLSDKLKQRKLLTALGYGLGALSKPLFAVAPTPGLVLAARVSDRIGKGIRGAPRDALIGDLAPASRRGGAYGLRQALDSLGALIGPLLAVALMALLADNIRAVFWLALLPGVLSVVILLRYVHEPPHHSRETVQRPRFRTKDLGALGPLYWWVVAIGGILTLARFSEAFLILMARDRGLALGLAPIALAVMSLAYSLSSYPAGALSDRIGSRAILAAGFLVLIVADAVIATAQGLAMGLIGIALWGLHMGLTQGLLAALVADATPSDVRGTAFGIFHFVSGLATLAASVIAGLLWDNIGPEATFLAGAAFTAFGLAGLLRIGWTRWPHR